MQVADGGQELYLCKAVDDIPWRIRNVSGNEEQLPLSIWSERILNAVETYLSSRDQ